ncbi:hypothetical protein NC652_007032 [Populus alba x Populus x berolinensis]|uniref:Uncharacterized protein n=1 Tax=Populus alba x Populus x berolinensis TaxID=444605 RepID=A0AAD6RFV8_9ROSI|nr:hypothetical protein NC652_007032 [Populus alba x Populus x berolinensis]KAJ7008103.1 hypothetical protein NC653_006959 [Populus alba x Populus x berolinensis]
MLNPLKVKVWDSIIGFSKRIHYERKRTTFFLLSQTISLLTNAILVIFFQTSTSKILPSFFSCSETPPSSVILYLFFLFVKFNFFL